MSRVARIIKKYKQENISIDTLANECIKVIIKLENGYKRVVSLNEEESNEFLYNTITLKSN